MTVDGRDICRAAVERYGRISQIIKAMEEMGELSHALARWLNGAPDWDNICEEVADVEIMMAQLEIILDDIRPGLVAHKKDEKLQRLARRLDQLDEVTNDEPADE